MQDVSIDNVELRKENSSKTYYTGSVWDTNSYGLVTVVGQTTRFRARKDGREFCYFLVEFTDGTLVEVEASHIKRGQIRNPFHPSVYGVGFMGRGPWKASINNKDTKEYKLWHGMMERSYCVETKEKYPTYKDCTVDERWHNFQNFCEDIKELEGYNEWKNNNICRGWDLDKDIRVPGNKIYSLDTCIFIPHEENIAYSNRTGLVYIGTRIENGYEEEFICIKTFVEKYKLNQGNVQSCLKGRRKTNKGWKFRVKKKENDPRHI